MPFRLQVPRILHEEMIAQARAENPNECCGLLAGIVEDEEGAKIGRVVRRYPLLNTLASPVEFLSDARSMFDADRDMRKHALDMLAVYHSHPTSEPIPSKKDLARHNMPEVACLIVSLVAELPIVRGWWLTEVDYRAADLEVTE